jgi:hypothetical protein
MADRHRLRLVFQNFDAHAVRSLHEGLVQSVVIARKDPHTRGFIGRERRGLLTTTFCAKPL